MGTTDETTPAASSPSSPERQAPPEQVAQGTVDLWPVLRDPQLAAWIERGEVDPVLYELHAMARSHDPTVADALRRRAEAVGLSLEGPPAPPVSDVKPFRWSTVTKGG